MPITIEEAIHKLESTGLKVGRARDGGDHCGLLMQTRSYVNAEGEHSLQLVCRVDHGGFYIEVAAPRAYNADDAKYPGALFEALLRMCYQLQHVRAEHDASDGEVRFAIDMPVLDGEVTSHQLGAMVAVLSMAIDDFHDVIVHAMETGKVDLELRRSVGEEEQPGDDDGDEPGDEGGDGEDGDDGQDD